jgi:two-component system chemotaxis response regulator CheY
MLRRGFSQSIAVKAAEDVADFLEGKMTVDLTMSVLVVDDSRTMGQIVRNLLILIGFQDVDHVLDGVTALTRLHQKSYGLVVSDWNMQPMTGQTLLRVIRANPLLQSIRFIMVTAESNEAIVTAARNAGADHYILKPFTGEMLRKKIVAVLAPENVRSSSRYAS